MLVKHVDTELLIFQQFMFILPIKAKISNLFTIFFLIHHDKVIFWVSPH